MPVSVDPNFVILPFAVLSAMAIAVTASLFKNCWTFRLTVPN
ncbi:DUF4400 domain-containing protein [Thioalkalivibrio sp.]|nr:DUF4400 domain-containing protein [Thioalkalivibrio sp.]